MRTAAVAALGFTGREASVSRRPPAPTMPGDDSSFCRSDALAGGAAGASARPSRRPRNAGRSPRQAYPNMGMEEVILYRTGAPRSPPSDSRTLSRAPLGRGCTVITGGSGDSGGRLARTEQGARLRFLRNLVPPDLLSSPAIRLLLLSAPAIPRQPSDRRARLMICMDHTYGTNN